MSERHKIGRREFLRLSAAATAGAIAAGCMPAPPPNEGSSIDGKTVIEVSSACVLADRVLKVGVIHPDLLALPENAGMLNPEGIVSINDAYQLPYDLTYALSGNPELEAVYFNQFSNQIGIIDECSLVNMHDDLLRLANSGYTVTGISKSGGPILHTDPSAFNINAFLIKPTGDGNTYRLFFNGNIVKTEHVGKDQALAQVDEVITKLSFNNQHGPKSYEQTLASIVEANRFDGYCQLFCVNPLYAHS